MNSKFALFLCGILFVFACASPDPKGEAAKDSLVVDSAKVVAADHLPVTSLPDWAKELKLSEPKNMKLVTGMSHLTSAVVPGEGFNSVTLVYSGNYDTAMSQARRIAKKANLPLSKKYKALKKQADRVGHGNRIKGITYMNYDFSTRNADFLIYVQVDEKGMLTLSATDMKQMNLQLRRHAGIEKRKR